MDTNIQNFIVANKDSFVNAMRKQTFTKVSPQTQYPGCFKAFQDLAEEQQMEILESLNYDETVTATPVEPIVVPSSVEILTYTNEKGGTSRYARLPYISRTKTSYFIVQYGATEMYVRLGDNVAGIVYGDYTPNAGDLITVNMEAVKRDTDKSSPLFGKFVSVIHASADEKCQQYIAYKAKYSKSPVQLARQAVKEDTTGTLTFKKAINAVLEEIGSVTASNVKSLIANQKSVSFEEFLKNGGQ